MSVEAARSVDESNSYMTQMLSAMNEITATSKEIGKIVKAIDDIAFQTNILSLNAAVGSGKSGCFRQGLCRRRGRSAQSGSALGQRRQRARRRLSRARFLLSTTAEKLREQPQARCILSRKGGRCQRAGCQNSRGLPQSGLRDRAGASGHRSGFNRCSDEFRNRRGKRRSSRGACRTGRASFGNDQSIPALFERLIDRINEKAALKKRRLRQRFASTGVP